MDGLNGWQCMTSDDDQGHPITDHHGDDGHDWRNWRRVNKQQPQLEHWPKVPMENLDSRLLVRLLAMSMTLRTLSCAPLPKDCHRNFELLLWSRKHAKKPFFRFSKQPPFLPQCIKLIKLETCSSPRLILDEINSAERTLKPNENPWNVLKLVLVFTHHWKGHFFYFTKHKGESTKNPGDSKSTQRA